MKTPWDAKVKPFKKRQKEEEKEDLRVMLSAIVNQEARAASKEKALHSIYKSVYNLPKGIEMSGPGSKLRMIVNSSSALSDFSELIETPIDPRLIYFHEQLPEYKVNKAV